MKQDLEASFPGSGEGAQGGSSTHSGQAWKEGLRDFSAGNGVVWGERLPVEVAGHPASPGVTGQSSGPHLVVSHSCEAGTRGQPAQLWPHCPVTVGQHMWECFPSMSAKRGKKLRERGSGRVLGEEHSVSGPVTDSDPRNNHSLSSLLLGLSVGVGVLVQHGSGPGSAEQEALLLTKGTGTAQLWEMREKQISPAGGGFRGTWITGPGDLGIQLV